MVKFDWWQGDGRRGARTLLRWGRSRGGAGRRRGSRRHQPGIVRIVFQKYFCVVWKYFAYQPCHECLECQDNADPALCPPGHLRVFNGSKWRKESRVYWQSHSDTDYTRSVPSPAWPNTNDNETIPELPCQKCGQWARGAAARQQVSQVDKIFIKS